jgi:hypothetical protein
MKGTLAWAILAASSGSAWAGGFDFDAYQSSPTGSWAEAIAVGDVDGDRLEDVVLATTRYFDEANDHHVFVYRQRSDGSLAAPIKFKYGEFTNGVAVSLADLNKDGALDIVTGHLGGLFVLLSNGSGGFTQRAFAPTGAISPTAECYSLAILDINLDGNLDVLGQSWSNGATVFYGDGRGGVTSMAHMQTGAKGYNDIKAGDVTGDGRPDLVMVSRQSPDFFVYPHDGKQGFAPGVPYPTPSTTWWVGSVALGDFDSDGLNEVVVASPANKPESNLYLYRQDASGRLQSPPTPIASNDIPGALIARDLDRDGRQDLLVGHDGWATIGRYMQGASGLDTVELLNPAPFNDGPQALAAGDFNDDGCTDVAIAEHNFGLVTLRGSGCAKGRASSDFDGDGSSDFLWHNDASGANVIWRSGDHGTQQEVTDVTNTAWFVAGIGDFDGDGKADILWHNGSNGTSVIWKAGDYGNAQGVTQVTNRAWKITGVADFDGDGKDDILWRNTSTGGNAIWRSGDYGSQLPITAVTNTLWYVAAIADFDGDGEADLLWRHANTGRNAVWLSADYGTQKPITDVTDLGWTIAGAGDFDGDQRADLLWRHTNGANVLWKSADYSHNERLQAMSPTWELAAIGDYDGNGKDDLVWRHTSSGENMIWRAAIKSVTRPVTAVTSLKWAIQK